MYPKAIKLFTSAMLLSAISVSVVNATTVASGSTASLTLDQTILSTFKGGNNLNSANVNGSRYMYVNQFYNDSEFTYVDPADCPAGGIALCNDTPTNTTGLAPDTQPYQLPVVPTGVAPYQAANIATNWDSSTGGSIGLAGALKIKSDFQNSNLSIRWGELSLNNTGSTWTLNDNLNSGSIFQLTNVSATDNGSGSLILSADLIFGNSAWASFLSGGTLKFNVPSELNTTVGHINIAPVPVPAAVWFMGSALLGLAGFRRKTGFGNQLAA